MPPPRTVERQELVDAAIAVAFARNGCRKARLTVAKIKDDIHQQRKEQDLDPWEWLTPSLITGRLRVLRNMRRVIEAHSPKSNEQSMTYGLTEKGEKEFLPFNNPMKAGERQERDMSSDDSGGTDTGKDEYRESLAPLLARIANGPDVDDVQDVARHVDAGVDAIALDRLLGGALLDEPMRERIKLALEEVSDFERQMKKGLESGDIGRLCAAYRRLEAADKAMPAGKQVSRAEIEQILKDKKELEDEVNGEEERQRKAAGSRSERLKAIPWKGIGVAVGVFVLLLVAILGTLVYTGSWGGGKKEVVSAQRKAPAGDKEEGSASRLTSEGDKYLLRVIEEQKARLQGDSEKEND